MEVVWPIRCGYQTRLVVVCLLAFILGGSSDFIKVLDPEVDSSGWILAGLTYVKSAKDIDKAILAIEPEVANLEGEGIYWAYMTYVQVLKDPNVAPHRGVHVNLRYYINGDSQIVVAPIYDNETGECPISYTGSAVEWQTINQTISKDQFRMWDYLIGRSDVFILIESLQVVLTDDIPVFPMPCPIGPVHTTSSAPTTNPTTKTASTSPYPTTTPPSTTCHLYVTANESHFISPNYPGVYNNLGSCIAIVPKLPNVVQLRLDIEGFISDPNADGVCVTDMLDIVGSDEKHVPQLCGIFAGQHMYLNFGSSNFMSFNITSLSTGDKIWNIKITMIEPNSSAVMAPDGCMQYYYGAPSGRATILGYNQFQPHTPHLANLDYTLCVRKEMGFSAIQWSACEQLGSFSMSMDAYKPRAYHDEFCQNDYIQVLGSTTIPYGMLTHNIFCGSALSAVDGAYNSTPILSDVRPFLVHVRTDDNEEFDKYNSGFCLDYKQL